MKVRHAPFAFAFALVAIGGACNHPQRKPDWRSPSPPMVCASDADCRGGTCTIEVGAEQGTCGSPSGLGEPLRSTDGGIAPGPGPNIQPSSSDVHL